MALGSESTAEEANDSEAELLVFKLAKFGCFNIPINIPINIIIYIYIPYIFEYEFERHKIVEPC